MGNTKEYQKTFYLKHPEKRREYFAKYKASHIQQIKDKDKRYYLNNKEMCQKKNVPLVRKWRKKLGDEVIKHYGGKCICCGEAIREFLSIDHINGGRGKKKEPNLSGWMFYYWLKRNNYPKGFQVMCYNCNLAKGFYGKCPHKK